VPDERLEISAVVFGETLDGGFKFLGGAVDARMKLFLCQLRERSFDYVQRQFLS
jgi:hypothetical protein